MAKLSIKAGATSVTVNVFIQDSSSTTGAGLTGLVYNTASLVAYYALPRAASVAITLATLAAVTSAYSSGGFKEIDATNMAGWYRFDIPDSAVASGRFSSIHLKGAANMAPLPLEIELTGWDNSDGVHGGMTALPNAAAEAAGGLYTRGTGAGQINQDANGRVDVNLKAAAGTAATLDANNVLNVSAKYLAGTALTGRDIGASVLLSSGTGTGQVKLASGYIAPNWGDVGNPTTVNNLSGTTFKTLTDAPADSAGTTTLLARWTATRAGYVDNLSGGAVALASGVPLAAADAAKLAAVWQIHGLDLSNDLTVSATARAVGTIVQSLTTLAGTTTVHRSA